MTDVATAILWLAGSAFALLAAVGVLRMPDVFTRMQASTKASTLGLGCLLAGVALRHPDVSFVVRAGSIAAFMLLIPLAVTSTRAMARRLGRRWQTLHRLIYAIGVLAILHFWWMKAGKHDLAQPKLYAAIMVVLLGWRIGAWLFARYQARAGTRTV